MKENLHPKETEKRGVLDDIFLRGYALIGGAYDASVDIGIHPREISQFGFGWKDGYYIKLSHEFGIPRWYRQYKAIYKSVTAEDQHIYRYVFPLDKNEEHGAFGQIDRKLRLSLTKKDALEPEEMLESDLVHSIAWWKVFERKFRLYRHEGNPLQKFSASIAALDEHLKTHPAAAFIYFPLHDLTGASGEPEYDKRPLHLPEENVRQHLHASLL